MEKEAERRRRQEEEEARENGEEERERAVEDFEKVMMGLEGEARKAADGSARNREEEPAKEGRGVKRKFELDEEEMLANAKDERAKARKAIDDEKVQFTRHVLFLSFLAKISALGREVGAAILLGTLPHAIINDSRHNESSQAPSILSSLKRDLRPPALP